MTGLSEARMRAGVIGCGNISPVYFENLKTRYPVVDVVACADLLPERSRAAVDRFGVPAAVSTEDLLADPEIELVINLTNPAAHAEVSLAAIDAGKHVYSEKPLAVERADGQAIVDSATANGLSVGCAPDTVLGAGIQTCRKVIDEGRIGEPIAATAFMVNHGHESWHPSPEFFYKQGGGPMFDMGPYYLSALINLMGPVRRVTGSHRQDVRTTHHHQPAQSRHGHRSRGVDARRRGARLRVRRHRHDRHQLRRLGLRPATGSRSTAPRAR